MSKRSYRLPCLITVVILLSLTFCAAVGAVGYRLQKARLEEQRTRNTPPTVYVHSPTAGETVPEGGLVVARATAAGIVPIDKVELWINGELYQVDSPDPTVSPRPIKLDVAFDIEVPLGTHALVFRAVDEAGRVGQSPPIPIVGESLGDPQETTLVVTEDGKNLEDIAEGLGQDPDALAGLNPGIGDGPLPLGTRVNTPPKDGEKKDPPEPDDKPPVNIIDPAPLPVSQPIPELQPISSVAVSVRDLISIALTLLPKAPSNLTVGHEDCIVYMEWTDNAENESNFTVWMQRLGGPPQLIATLSGNSSTGPATYKFKSPGPGGYGFWIEAGNALGSQPSEIEWIFIGDLSCEVEIATQLEIQALDMSVPGPYNRTYCYLSLEGTAETRVPAKDGEFIQLQNNQWNITNHWGENNLLLIPIPADEELTIEGRCLGLVGATPPDILGAFSAAVPKESWDGRRLVLQADTGAYTVGYKIQYHGPSQAQGAYRFTDTHLNQPEIVGVTAKTTADPADKDWAARHITLEWKWDGNPDDIWGFVIFVDGNETRTVSKQVKEEAFLLGTSCSSKVDFQVAAFGPGGSQSPRSAVHTYQQPPCEVYASVHFISIQTGFTSDCTGIYCLEYKHSGPGENSPVLGPCDALQAYYNIWATSATQVIEKYWGGSNFLYFPCETQYYFSQIGDNDTLIVPIDPLDPRLRFGTRFRDWDFWWDDDIVVIGEEIDNTIEDWPNYDHTFQFVNENDEAWTLTTIRVRGFKSFDFDQN